MFPEFVCAEKAEPKKSKDLAHSHNHAYALTLTDTCIEFINTDKHTNVLSNTCTYISDKKADVNTTKSKQKQSNFHSESEQSAHPNYDVLYGALAGYSRKVLIKTSGGRAL